MKKISNKTTRKSLIRTTLLTAVFLFTGCGLGTMQDVENTQTVLEHAQARHERPDKRKPLETEYPYGPGLKMSCVKGAITCTEEAPWAIGHDINGETVYAHQCVAQMDHSGAAGWSFEGTRGVTASSIRVVGIDYVENSEGPYPPMVPTGYEARLIVQRGDEFKEMTAEGMVNTAHYIAADDYATHIEGWDLWSTSCATYVPGPNTQ